MFRVIPLLLVFISVSKTAFINEMAFELPVSSMNQLYPQKVMLPFMDTLYQPTGSNKAYYITSCPNAFLPQTCTAKWTMFPMTMDLVTEGIVVPYSNGNCVHTNLVQLPKPANVTIKGNVTPLGDTVKVHHSVAMKSGAPAMAPTSTDPPNKNNYKFDITQIKIGTSAPISNEEAVPYMEEYKSVYLNMLQGHITSAMANSINTDCAFKMFLCNFFNVPC